MKYTFCFIIFFISFGAFSQSYQIEFDQFVSSSSLNLENIKKNYSMKDINANYSSKMILNYSSGLSSYLEKKSELSKNKNITGEVTSEITLPAYYKDHDKKKSIKFFENFDPLLYGQDISVVSNISKYNWQLTSKKENISGYDCKLATHTTPGGTIISAWYTDEIALNEGPRDYWGLPGLILQLQVGNKVLIVAKSIRKIDSKLDIVLPKNKNVMTPSEFQDFQKELFKPQIITMPDGTQIIQE